MKSKIEKVTIRLIRRICFPAFLLLSLALTGQTDYRNGYVVTNRSDTLYGLVNYQNNIHNSRNCDFKYSKDSASTRFTPLDIKAYRISDGKLFISKKVTIDSQERIVFLEMLVDGKADLYYLPKNHYFIETDEKGIQLLKNSENIIYRDGEQYLKYGNEYISYLKIHLEDCPELVTDINESRFNQQHLINITTKYHELVCPDEQCINYTKSSFRIQNYLTVTSGISMNYLRLFNESESLQSRSAPGLIAGLQIESYNKGTFDKFFSILSFCYSNVLHSDLNDIPLNIPRQTVLIGLSFNYIYPKYRFKPYAGLGAMYTITFSDESAYVRYTFHNYDPKSKSFGYLLNAGLIFELSEHFSIKFHAEQMISLFNIGTSSNYGINSDNLNIVLGLQYRMHK